MRSKKKIVLENLTVESVAAEGKCIAHADGKVVFLTKCAPGDVVDARVTKKKLNYYEAVPTTYHQLSSVRQDPFCTHFNLCGGCKWQHMEYSSQLEYKQQQVVDQLERIGKLSLPPISPIIGSENTQLYRNKLEYTFTDSKWLTDDQVKSSEEIDRNGVGFHIPGRFDRIVDLDQCFLQKEPTNELRLYIKFFAIRNKMSFYNTKNHSGLLRNLVIRTTENDEVMVIVQFGKNDHENIKKLMQAIVNDFPEITSLNYIINTKKNDSYYDQEVINYSGLNYITEEINGIKFRVGPKSFFQTNTAQAKLLYAKVIVLADIKDNEVVYDLYCGTGTISNLVANKSKKVIGLEYVPEAIEDAELNSKINNISNTQFIAGDIKDLLSDNFFKEHSKPDLIITDPPRAGMHKDVVEAINNSGANKVVYVSCNPATQARDLELMSEMYVVEVVQPVDMFPQTHHVENIVLLSRK